NVSLPVVLSVNVPSEALWFSMSAEPAPDLFNEVTVTDLPFRRRVPMLPDPGLNDRELTELIAKLLPMTKMPLLIVTPPLNELAPLKVNVLLVRVMLRTKATCASVPPSLIEPLYDELRSLDPTVNVDNVAPVWLLVITPPAEPLRPPTVASVEFM